MIILITYYNLSKRAIISLNLFRKAEKKIVDNPLVKVSVFWDGPSKESDGRLSWKFPKVLLQLVQKIYCEKESFVIVVFTQN